MVRGVRVDSVPAVRSRARRANPVADADSGQEPLERGGRGAADVGGSRPQRDRRHAVPQAAQGGQLHRGGRLAVDTVRHRRALGKGHRRTHGGQQHTVPFRRPQTHVQDGI